MTNTFTVKQGPIEWRRTEKVVNRRFDPTVMVTWSTKTRLTGRQLTMTEFFGDVYVELDGVRQDHDPVVAYGWTRCYNKLERSYWDALEAKSERDEEVL